MVPVAVRLWVMVLGAGVESCTSGSSAPDVPRASSVKASIHKKKSAICRGRIENLFSSGDTACGCAGS